VSSVEHVGIGFRVQVIRVKVEGSELRVEGLGFDVEG